MALKKNSGRQWGEEMLSQQPLESIQEKDKHLARKLHAFIQEFKSVPLSS